MTWLANLTLRLLLKPQIELDRGDSSSVEFDHEMENRTFGKLVGNLRCTVVQARINRLRQAEFRR